MWGLLGGLVGGLIGKDSSRKAANTQADSAREAADLQREMFDKSAALQREMFDKNVALQTPAREAGIAAQNKLLQYLGLQTDQAQQQSPDFGKYTRDFGAQDFQQDPGYAFRMSEGLKALDRQAAARGGLISGAALKASQRYGQDMASNEYTNAFNRYQTNRSNQLNPLQSLMGAGQTAANTLGGAGQNYANMMGNAGQNYANQAGEAYMGAGNARASGYIGQGNALAGAINQGINSYGYNQMMRPGGGGGNMLGGLFSSGAGSSGFGGGSVQGNSDYQYDL
jgi:hypothetical protein